MFADTFQLQRYETWELDAMVAQIERPNPWLLRTFFTRTRMFESRSIEFDILDRGRRLAPFVAPQVAGKPSIREGYRTRQIAPAYIKPTDVVRPDEGFTRLPGEAYGGQLSPQQRVDRLVVEKLDLHMETIDNTLEWMAAQALVKGGITIKGEDYPEVHLDFGRNAKLNGQLFGAAKWNLATSNPVQDIETYSLLTRRISKGAVVDTIVMDGLTWQYMKQHSSVQDLLNVMFRRDLGNPTRIDQGPRHNINEAIYVGTLAGRFDLYVYDAYYQDDKGNDQPYLPPFTLLGIARAALEGTQYYGAIVDLHAGIQARKSFTKSKLKFEPSGIEIVTQSAPLAAPRRPNAMFTLTVA